MSCRDKREREIAKLLQKILAQFFGNGSSGDTESSLLRCWEAHRDLRGKKVTKLKNVTNNKSVCFPSLTPSLFPFPKI